MAENGGRDTRRDLELREALRAMYAGVSWAERARAVGRPLICPYPELLDQVPTGSTILDVGCGTGTFLNLLARSGRIARGIGIDASGAAIAAARRAAATLGSGVDVVFEHRAVEAGLPSGQYDVVSLIDVLHHIAREAQESALIEVGSRVRPGGILLFKDIGPRPLWRAWANRLHDLAVVREWITLVAPERIVSWLEAVGLVLSARATINMWWYGHELLVFRRADR